MTDITCPENSPNCRKFNLTCGDRQFISGGIIESGIDVNSITELQCTSQNGGEQIRLPKERQGSQANPRNMPFCPKGYKSVSYEVLDDETTNSSLISNLQFQCEGDDQFSGTFGSNLTSGGTNTSSINATFTCPQGKVFKNIKGTFSTESGLWSSIQMSEDDCVDNRVFNNDQDSDLFIISGIVASIILLLLLFIFRL